MTRTNNWQPICSSIDLLMEISKWSHKVLCPEEIKEDRVGKEAREVKVAQAKVQKMTTITCSTDVPQYLSLIRLSSV